MDRRSALVRNPQVRARALPSASDTPTSDTTAAPAEAVMVDVVVMSADVTLYEAIRHSVGERNPVWRARSAEEAVDLLMTGRCGVLLIDMAAVTTRPGTLVEQIVDQFPDVVVVVAGRREDESLLAGMISDGLVYRFMHKPLSPKRAGMFLNAAMRGHVERREGRAGERMLPLARELRSRLDPRKWLLVGAGLLLCVALVTGLLALRYGKQHDAGVPSTAASARQTPLSIPLADPVLSRARAAFAAGRYEAPPGRNALDLYAAVLLTRPGDVEAREGLANTTHRLASQAERAAAAGDAAEARRIAQRVLAVDRAHAGALAVIASLDVKPTPSPMPVAAPAAEPVPATTARAPAATAAAAAPASALLAGPVTRLPAQAGAAPIATPRQVTPIRVQPDPLTPRIIGSGVLPTSPSRKPPRNGSRQFGAPASSGHAIAGYVKRQPDVAASVAPAAVPTVLTSPSVQRRDLEPVATPGPTYPADAFRERVEGWVEVEFTVNSRGTTGDVAIVQAEPRGVFDEAAMAAVAAWRFRPRIVNSQPVAERTSVTLRFNVED